MYTTKRGFRVASLSGMSLRTACTTVTSSGVATSGHPAPPAADGPASPAGTVSGAIVPAAHFVAPDLGYAVFGGGQTDSTMARLDGGVPAVPGGGTLLRTSDGGRAWTRQYQVPRPRISSWPRGERSPSPPG